MAVNLAVDSGPGHEPFEVVARLVSSVGFDPPYGLDLAGLLATQMRAFDRASRPGPLARAPLPDTTEEEVFDMNLPLARCMTGSDWHWMASCAMPVDPDPDPEARTFYRVSDYSWAQRAAERPLPYYLSPSSGACRDVMMPAPVLVCGEVRWRGMGVLGEVERLLRPLRHIGRRRSVGEGGVLDWTVRPVEVSDPASWVHRHENQLTRPWPVECVQALGLDDDQWRMGNYAIRPPSWHPSRLRDLAMTAFEDEEEW